MNKSRSEGSKKPYRIGTLVLESRPGSCIVESRHRLLNNRRHYDTLRSDIALQFTETRRNIVYYAFQLDLRSCTSLQTFVPLKTNLFPLNLPSLGSLDLWTNNLTGRGARLGR